MGKVNDKINRLKLSKLEHFLKKYLRVNELINDFDYLMLKIMKFKS